MTTSPPRTTRPTRIIHVVDSLAVGGLEKLVQALIENRRAPFQHEVCALREIGDIGEQLRSKAVTVELLGRKEGPDRTVIPRLAKLLRRKQPRIVHVHSDGATDALPAARLAGVGATVFTEHGWTTPKMSKRRVWIRRLHLKAADRVVAVSEHLAGVLNQTLWVPERKLRKIRNAVPEMAVPTDTQRAHARNRLAITDATQVIGTVGAMRPVKNFENLLEALALLRKRRSDILLLMVGDGPHRTALELELRRLGLEDHVLMVGSCPNVHDYLAAMDVFALPSDLEGTSLALLEACWCGLPIVATDTGGNPEVIDTGTTGAVVPPRDPIAMAKALEAYLLDRDCARAHGSAARGRVREHYSLERFLDDYDSLYRELSSPR